MFANNPTNPPLSTKYGLSRGTLLSCAIAVSGALLQADDIAAIFGPGHHLQDGAFESEWLGTIHSGRDSWFKHQDLGWLYDAGIRENGEGGMLFSPEMGWLWFHPAIAPHFHRFDSDSWQYRASADGDGWQYDFALRRFWTSTHVPDAFYVVAHAAMHDAEATVNRALSKLPSTSQYPEYTGPGGSWVTKEPSWWTSGFWPGIIWQIYEFNRSGAWLIRARQWTAGLATQQYNTTTHDIGFMLYCSFGQGYRLTGDLSYRDVLVTGAGSLHSRFSPVVGGTRSWSWGSWHGNNRFTIIVDNMMNLELLFRASNMPDGNATWFDDALTHAHTTIRDHIRPDGGSWHAVVYDQRDGSVLEKRTYQGWNDDSTWSRGQAWLIYGLVLTYRETGDSAVLDAAIRSIAYFTSRLPDDHVPFWDFQAPGIPDTSRDTTAAAITASALLELATLQGDGIDHQRYWNQGVKMLRSLRDNYRNHDHDAILDQGTIFFLNNLRDTGVVYGDYYFIEGLMRYIKAIDSLSNK